MFQKIFFKIFWLSCCIFSYHGIYILILFVEGPWEADTKAGKKKLSFPSAAFSICVPFLSGSSEQTGRLARWGQVSPLCSPSGDHLFRARLNTVMKGPLKFPVVRHNRDPERCSTKMKSTAQTLPQGEEETVYGDSRSGQVLQVYQGHVLKKVPFFWCILLYKNV